MHRLPRQRRPAASEATIVKIGHAAPLTGSIAHLGKDNENGARLAVEEINAQGLTIDGHKIQLELDAQDDAADPKTGTAVAEETRRGSCGRRGRTPEFGRLDSSVEDL